MTVRSIGDIVAHLRETKRSPDQELWYRGHASPAYKLLPSIWRMHTREEERDLTNRFRARAAIRYPNSPRYDENAGWLSLMQHYGLPTRLLDWTRSPLIAAYFAVEHCIDGRPASGDAEIWVLDPFGLNVSEGFTPITPPIDANKCADMLIPAFADGYAENERVMAVMATETDMRMFVQQGCFTIHSRQQPLEEASHVDRSLASMVVPRECVGSLAEEVRLCGFRKGDIYPDLGHLARELTTTNPGTRLA